jgi:hypothetical protein
MNPKKPLILLGMLIVIGTVVASCGTTTPKPATESEPPSDSADISSQPEMPFLAEWRESAHANASSEAFRHWDGDDPAEIPVFCAKCHSSDGYLDFLGADGSDAGRVNAAVPALNAQGVACAACHNPVTLKKTTVTFPSGVTITAGDDARCMECHQGRESRVSVNAQMERFGATSAPDIVVAPIQNEQGNDVFFGFLNVHYYAAAATLYGGMAQGGYQYDGKTYNIRNDHVEGYNTCSGCHDPHTLEVKAQECALCHDNVNDYKDIRMISSARDYNGNGNATEGMYYEIKGLQDALYAEIQNYAAIIAGEAIVYDQSAYPYFFIDTNANGVVDEGEAIFPNAYKNWTPRLLKAAYNYQASLKDPGAYAHNNKYIIQLLYDSIVDLGGNTSSMARDSAGHFAGNTIAFRFWDFNTGGQPVHTVPGTCAKCHSASGLPQFINEGTNLSNPSSNGFACTTCHNPASSPRLYRVNSVTFPSGAVISFGGRDAEGNYLPDDNNMCLQCHQGLSSKVIVDRMLDSRALDAPDPSIRLSNIHYFPAGATLFGSEVQAAYMYDGKEYVSMFMHASETGMLNKCQDCHSVHALEPKTASCQTCHDVTNPADIRENTVDYDGDGDVTEGMKGEIETLIEALYAELQTYAAANDNEIIYNPARYPYFLGSDGQAYSAWTPRLLKAAFNYQYARRDAGGYAHNPKFIIQFLIDSIEDLSGNVSRYTRP